jgi:hypothetical protein
MSKSVRLAGLAVLISLAASGMLAAASAPKAAPGTVVIIFKDGHRQAYNLSDISRIEFPASESAADAPSAGALPPSRGHFLGKWNVGDGNGGNFTIRLEENGDAYRSLGDQHGKWQYIDGEARVTWDDGAQDAIRKVGPGFQKFAYSMGKSFTDVPDNVTNARNTTPHPI